MSSNRLLKEARDLRAEMAKSNDPEIILTPDESNLYHWRGSIKGPEGTPYEVSEYFAARLWSFLVRLSY